MKISGIKVLLWDVDGTLARSSKLMPLIHDAQKRLIAKELDVTIEEATNLWLENRDRFHSTTQLTAFIIKKDPVETGVLIERAAQKWKATPSDPELVAMFSRLTGFAHYICGNGIREGIEEQLKALGLDPSIFKKIFSIDVAGKPKPDTAMFHMALADTGLPPAAHMMIGDRIDVDIIPAKSVGIHTCLIGPENPLADVSVPTIYDVEGIVTI